MELADSPESDWMATCRFVVERLKDKLKMGRKWPVNYLVRPWGADCNTEHQQISDGSEASSNI